MFPRMTALALMLGCLLGLSVAAPSPDPKPSKADIEKSKKALQDIQEFVGQWNMDGQVKVGAKSESWKEKAEWSWKFDKPTGDAWFVAKFEKGKFYTGGELRYVPAKKKFQLTLTPVAGAAQVFEGEAKNGTLTFTRKDEGTGDVYRMKLDTKAEGVRMGTLVEKQEKGKGPYTEVFKQNGTKEGESFAGGAKKPECIVTGGAGTMQVSYGGKTYYVCCSGCRDEFNANPEKIIKEAAKKK